MDLCHFDLALLQGSNFVKLCQGTIKFCQTLSGYHNELTCCSVSFRDKFQKILLAATGSQAAQEYEAHFLAGLPACTSEPPDLECQRLLQSLVLRRLYLPALTLLRTMPSSSTFSALP